MLPQAYASHVDVRGWLMSEKLDGVRGFWDGDKLYSKNGYPLNPPSEFTHGLPDFHLEGEIWGGRGTFEQTAAVVQRSKDDAGWLELKFAIFDVPEAGTPFAERIAKAREWLAASPSPYAFVIPQIPVQNREHLQQELERIDNLGGEGLVVRNPEAHYQAGRNAEILKVKSFQDAEAVVVAHVPGAGRNSGRLGSLLVELPDGIRFKIGTGFRDAERDNPPCVGETITFKHYGYYRSGRPKFPSFLRIRQDREL